MAPAAVARVSENRQTSCPSVFQILCQRQLFFRMGIFIRIANVFLVRASAIFLFAFRDRSQYYRSRLSILEQSI
jgi:hypothetical protein